MNSFLSGSVNTHWARAGKHKFRTRASKHKFRGGGGGGGGSRTGKYKLGTRAGKHKLGTRAGGWGRGLGQGPGNTNTLILE